MRSNLENVYLLTKHYKGQLIAPILVPSSLNVVEVDNFDTDSLGTFAGEVERTMSPTECALFKAKKACELMGSNIGIGSEGSFGGGPVPGFINWNQEILCYYQQEPELIVYAHAEGPCGVNNIEAVSREHLLEELALHPGQYWIHRAHADVHKGLSAQKVIDMFDAVTHQSTFQLEPDLRAHLCPERQVMIQNSARDLVERLNSNCPQCATVNFVVKQTLPGLECSLCGLPTKQIRSYVKQCDLCDFEERSHSDQEAGDPTCCDYCNP